MNIFDKSIRCLIKTSCPLFFLSAPSQSASLSASKTPPQNGPPINERKNNPSSWSFVKKTLKTVNLSVHLCVNLSVKLSNMGKNFSLPRTKPRQKQPKPPRSHFPQHLFPKYLPFPRIFHLSPKTARHFPCMLITLSFPATSTSPSSERTF